MLQNPQIRRVFVNYYTMTLRISKVAYVVPFTGNSILPGCTAPLLSLTENNPRNWDELTETSQYFLGAIRLQKYPSLRQSSCSSIRRRSASSRPQRRPRKSFRRALPSGTHAPDHARKPQRNRCPRRCAIHEQLQRQQRVWWDDESASWWCAAVAASVKAMRQGMCLMQNLHLSIAYGSPRTLSTTTLPE